MTVSINIVAETAVEAVQAVLDLAHNFGKSVDNRLPMTPAEVAAAAPPPSQPSNDVVAEPVAEKKTRTKKGDKAPETIEGTATVVSEGALMLTIDDARERMRTFNSAGHIDESLAGLTEFGAKKLSEVDPEAGGKPSVKYAELIAHIETLIAAKPAA